MIAPGAPALTAKTVPTYGVEVYFASLHVDVDRITVWRVADGVREAVSGALKASAAGDFVVTDWLVPFGVVSTYVPEVFDIAGASLTGAPASITVTSDEVVFQNVVDPGQSFPVELRQPSLSPIEFGTRNQQVFVAGLRRPFTQFWGEGSIVGLPLVTWTETDVQAALLLSVTAWPQMVVRTPPTFTTLPRILYAAVQRPTHEYLVNVGADRPIVWTLIVDESHPFSKATVRPLVTWDDWTAAFPSGSFTWNDVLAIFAAGTWTDAKRVGP